MKVTRRLQVCLALFMIEFRYVYSVNVKSISTFVFSNSIPAVNHIISRSQ